MYETAGTQRIKLLVHSCNQYTLGLWWFKDIGIAILSIEKHCNIRLRLSMGCAVGQLEREFPVEKDGSVSDSDSRTVIASCIKVQ
jgi:hypothetical protein